MATATTPRAALFGKGNIDWNAVFKTSSLDSTITRHLAKTYLALTATTMAAAVGVAFNLYFLISPKVSIYAMFAAILAVSFTPEHRLQLRCGLLGVFGFIQGMVIAPLIGYVMTIDPRIISTALLSTTTIFVCFSLSALLSERRSWLYLGGFLSSALSLLVFSSWFSLLFGGLFLFNFRLYFGLLVFIGYVIFDTQLIIERASAGSKDFVSDALQLFTDFMAIFLRILAILAKDRKKSKK